MVPELAEGNQHMQYFFQQDVHHVGIMTVRAVLAQPEEIGGFQFRSVPFVPDDAIMNEKSAVAVDFGGNVVGTIDESID